MKAGVILYGFINPLRGVQIFGIVDNYYPNGKITQGVKPPIKPMVKWV